MAPSLIASPIWTVGSGGIFSAQRCSKNGLMCIAIRTRTPAITRQKAVRSIRSTRNFVPSTHACGGTSGKTE